jgi:hypothetical protein
VHETATASAGASDRLGGVILSETISSSLRRDLREEAIETVVEA